MFTKEVVHITLLMLWVAFAEHPSYQGISKYVQYPFNIYSIHPSDQCLPSSITSHWCCCGLKVAGIRPRAFDARDITTLPPRQGGRRTAIILLGEQSTVRVLLRHVSAGEAALAGVVLFGLELDLLEIEGRVVARGIPGLGKRSADSRIVGASILKPLKRDI